MDDPRADMTDQSTLADRLKSAQEECDRLSAENARLRAMLGIQDFISKESGATAIPVVSASDSNIAAPSTPEKKISLFRSLFRGREEQFSPARLDYHPVVPGTLESGIVFSLDQTAPAHQGFLRHLGERGKDSSVGRPLSLRLGGDRQKATRARAKPLQNSANSQCDDFRKNPYIRGVFQLQRRVPDRRAMYSIEPVRLTIGHY